MARYQIKNVWFGAAAPLALMAKKLRKEGANNIVALSHGHEIWWARVPILKMAFQKIIKSIDYLGYLGEYTKNEILNSSSEIKSQSEKFIQIAPGIDTNHFTPRPKNHELLAKYQLQGRRVIVCVGRLVHRKGQDQLIKALPKILEQFPDAIL